MIEKNMRVNQDYYDFLAEKIVTAKKGGFSVQQSDIHTMLKPHQRDIVEWAVAGGCRAIFAAFGLGKSFMQLEAMRHIGQREGGRQLIICPLGVRHEFRLDAEKLGMSITFVRRDEEVTGDGLCLTNYESVRDGRLSVDLFNAVSLDEASVLRSFGSKTYQTFLGLFEGVKFKFVATATPSPNRYKELIHYAGFLGIMDTGESLTRFFQRDSTKANNLTLYPHMEREFWAWVSSWAIFLQKPSDLGYSDEGYDLPGLQVHYHEVLSSTARAKTKDGQLTMFADAAISLQSAAKEKRNSMDARVAKMMEIIEADPDSHYILWHDQEAERHAIKKALPEAVEVYGSLDLDEREDRILGFAEGRSKYLATKPVLSGSGCNFQRHCHKAIFIGINFKFNDLIQAIHRVHRFLQDKPCEIHIIYANTEHRILEVLRQKWAQHNDMVARMSELIRTHGLSNHGMIESLKRSIGVDRTVKRGKNFLIAHNDCVVESRKMQENSVDMIVTSIPFANHYEYTPSFNDFGHTKNNDHFWRQMDFLTPELLRVLRPGRIYACHVKDRILFGNVTGKGVPTVSPFHAETIFHCMKHGFDYMGMVTVVTDVVRENNQTYRLGWSEQCKDGTKMGVGSPEYIILMRKPQTDRSRGYADEPVTKSKDEYTRARWQVDAHAFWRSSGDRMCTVEEMAMMGPDELARVYTEYSLNAVYDYEDHVRIGEALDEKGALPATFMSLAPGSADPDVWHDVCRMRTLNGEQTRRGLANHVCLARGSLVLTRRGYVEIQNVMAGDMVLTHKGRWRAVQIVAKTGTRHVVDLRAQGVACLKLTPEHKVWTRISTWARQRDGAERAVPKWVRADESVGGYVNLKLPPVEDSVLTAQECWILGRWLADGHVGTRGDFFVSVGHDKLEHFGKMAGKHAGTRADRTAVQVRLKSLRPEVVATLNLCGSGAENKQVPSILLCLPEDKANAVLSGYLSGDGHFVEDRGRWMATSVSRALLLGMAMLAQRVHGVAASIHAGRPAGTATIDNRKVNTRQEWCLSFDIEGKRRKAPFVLDDGAWKKVRSASAAGIEETWCLRVEEDASFTAEGCVVANCPLQVDIVNRLITRYTNKGETVFDPFGGIGTVPYCAVKLGRKGRSSELNPDYFRDSECYLVAADNEQKAPSLFDLMGRVA